MFNSISRWLFYPTICDTTIDDDTTKQAQNKIISNCEKILLFINANGLGIGVFGIKKGVDYDDHVIIKLSIVGTTITFIGISCLGAMCIARYFQLKKLESLRQMEELNIKNLELSKGINVNLIKFDQNEEYKNV